MGKPFKKEIQHISETFIWATTVSLPNLNDLLDYPSFIVGSGGSLSACHFLSLLLQSKGVIAKAITPLELTNSPNAIRGANLIFISAGGSNSDILVAYKFALIHDAKRIVGFCMKENTKLRSLAENDSVTRIFEWESPAGKDGFLATNSLVAYFIILSRIFNQEIEMATEKTVPSLEFDDYINKLHRDFSIHVLYGGWALPIAIDLESKFTEAGLGNILLADFRNFGHGRHNWFDKRREQSAIVALVSLDEKILAEKTLSLLPATIPRLIIETQNCGINASIDLLIKSFYFVEALGRHRNIDPGKPGVPPYGSKLYHLRVLPEALSNSKSTIVKNTSILRKSGKNYIAELSEKEFDFWSAAYFTYLKIINKAKFGGLVVDYDGTICTNEERKTFPAKGIVDSLIAILEKGFLLGIVTGRGKSIRHTLQGCIPKDLWKNVLVGYYNGAEIGFLENDALPNVNADVYPPLMRLYNVVRKYDFLDSDPKITLRPSQLTIEKGEHTNWRDVKSQCIDLFTRSGLDNLEVLDSGHSLDVIARPAVSKRNIFKPFQAELIARNLVEDFLCVGDKGKYPGNDYELLTAKYSLSVDDVSTSSETCWNFLYPGQVGARAFLTYLESMTFHENYFSITI